MNTKQSTNPVSLIEVTDPAEIEASRRRGEAFDRNVDWLKAHAEKIYSQYRGKTIAIANQEVFAADSVQESLRLAKAAHPDDAGCFVMRIPLERMPKIYAVAG